jgi:Ran GTPase-activating protein (RanGAP) involved in mRNA processing and transport
MSRRRQVRLYINDEEELDLRRKEIRYAQAKRIAMELSTNTTLIYLNLGDNRIGDAGAVALARALATNKSLKDLRLFRNCITDLGMATLARSLVQNSSLAKLNVNSNKFTAEAVWELGVALKENKGLMELWLCCNSIRDDYGMSSVWEALRTNTTLRNLYLQHNSLDGAPDLAGALRCNTTLTGIFLHGNFPIRDKLVIIADALKRDTALRALDLGRCGVSYEGAVALAHAMRRKCGFTSVWLDDNFIRDAGSMLIAAALHESIVLTKLFLNGNCIGPAGAAALARALRTNTCLQILGLGRNRIGNDGTVAIADVLKTNTTLVRLDLYDNIISDKGAVAIHRTLENNVTLMSLNMEVNTNISPSLLQAINFVVASRQALMFLLKHVNKPLQKRDIPMVVQVVNRHSIFHRNAALVHCDKTSANTGFVFHLVRAAALSESGVIKLSSDTGSCWGTFENTCMELPSCPVMSRPVKWPYLYNDDEESRRRYCVTSGIHHLRPSGRSYWPIADYYWYAYAKLRQAPSHNCSHFVFVHSHIMQASAA